MKVFTYFQPTPAINPVDEAKLILVWAESWKRAGAEPIVLNEYHASQQGRVYDSYNQAISALPSVNPAGYDRACFMRWLAAALNPLTEPNESFLMTDYDVAGYDLKALLKYNKSKSLVFFQRHVPCCVMGNRQGFLSLCKRFMEYQLRPEDTVDNKPHISDQYALLRFFEAEPEWAISLQLVRHYSEEGWESAPAVHFPNAVMVPNFTPRYAYIPRLRPF